mmetsp:Transcript_9178/g.24034  ORF Transcript_9178/g.24034 Transcript_9178/m.24034 type:complete len:368 (-) Transcript_9178:539-1642(-)
MWIPEARLYAVQLLLHPRSRALHPGEIWSSPGRAPCGAVAPYSKFAAHPRCTYNRSVREQCTAVDPSPHSSRQPPSLLSTLLASQRIIVNPSCIRGGHTPTRAICRPPFRACSGGGPSPLHGGLRPGVILLLRQGEERIHLAHVHVERLARLHDDAVTRLGVDDDLERLVDAHVAHKRSRRHLGEAIPVTVIGNLGALLWIDGHIPEAEGDDVLEEVRALRNGHMLIEHRLDDERRLVDVLPGDRDASRRVSGAPAPWRHEQVPPALALELAVDGSNLGGDLCRLALIKAVGRDVHHVGDALKAAVAERTRRRHRCVVRRRHKLEAVGGARLELRLRPQLEQVQLVALAGPLARLESKFNLNRTAKA